MDVCCQQTPRVGVLEYRPEHLGYPIHKVEHLEALLLVSLKLSVDHSRLHHLIYREFIITLYFYTSSQKTHILHIISSHSSISEDLCFDINSYSEFPSLSGAQPQFQNPGQAVWANANQRATQQTPVQRPQQSQPSVPATIPAQQQVHHAQEQSQQSLDEAFFASQFNGGIDDYRHGGQSGVGQLPGSQETQATSIDDFPPLGRNGHGEIGQDRRGNLMHNASGGGSLAAFAALNTGK